MGGSTGGATSAAQRGSGFGRNSPLLELASNDPTSTYFRSSSLQRGASLMNPPPGSTPVQGPTVPMSKITARTPLLEDDRESCV